LLGIASNAQFYTKRMLDAEIKRVSRGRLKKWQQVFDPKLCTFSFEVGFSKPNAKFFGKILKELKERNVSPREAVFIGNDMLKDIWTAKKAGLKTVLFAGDKNSLKLRERRKKCRNLEIDAKIKDWKELLSILR